MTLIIGFTGSRKGMNEHQRRRVAQTLLIATEAHHGDCFGSDEQFHELALDAGVRVVIHPPINVRLRAFCKGDVTVLGQKDYLTRNRDIVNSSDMLLATPNERYEPAVARGQGTWATVRYARTKGKPIIIIWPTGDPRMEGRRA